jgi:hypothetical protein
LLFSPAGYKTQFDAFANSLALYLNIGTEEFQNTIVEYSIALKNERPLNLLPAFGRQSKTLMSIGICLKQLQMNLGIILMNFITVAVGLWLTAFMDWGCCLKKKKEASEVLKQ